jgi:ligand-binding sensor domain-containing protein
MNTPTIWNSLRKWVGILAITICEASMAAAVGQQPQFNIMKPSTTGVPCDEVRLMGFDPAGNLWIAGRLIYWQEAAVAMLSADQLEHHPLPGGGFDTGAWKVWSSVHGNPIPSLYMRGLAFSSDGTMWFGSEGGLTRFRPNAQNPADRWFTYTPANSPLVLNEVRSISMDSHGNLWIANASLNYAFSYLFKLNPATGQWTSISTGHQPLEITVGNNDHVFASMKDTGGVIEFDGTSWVLHEALPRELDNLMQDAQGNLWAAGSGINGEGLWKWNGSRWQSWPSLNGDVTVTGIGKDRNGVVYVSMWYGAIYKMINGNFPVLFADAEPLPRNVMARPNGDIWVNNYGSNLGIGTVRQYNATGQLLRRMNVYNSGLPDYFIDRIVRDSSGNMWFAGSNGGGLSRMLGSNGAPEAATHWRNWSMHNANSEPYPWGDNEPMYSVMEDDNGMFWMGGIGVGCWNSVTGEIAQFWNSQNSALDTSGINRIAKRQGTVWLGTGGSGVYWLNGNTWTRVLLDSTWNYDINYVNAMAVDTANNLWVGSNFGLRKFAPGDNVNFTEYYTTNSPLPGDYIIALMADPSGGIWIGTAGGGLVRFNGTTWKVYNQGNTGMPGTNVTDIARRPSDGLIAIANNQPSVWPYTGGVSTYDGTTWKHYTPNNSPLIHWQISAVEFDANGNLWASDGSEGVVQIMIGPAAPLQVVSAVSRKTHGAAGAFDIPLPLLGEPGVECRSSAGAHTLVFTFDDNVVSGTAQIAAGTATLSGNPVFAGRTMTVNLSAVADQQTITVSVVNVRATSGATLPSASVNAHMLAGDTSGNGIVNATDVSQTKLRSGQAVNAQTFRSDVIANGTINASDLGLVKLRSGSDIQ